MDLDRSPELSALLSTWLAECDAEADEQAIRSFLSASSSDQKEKVVAQATLLRDAAEIPLEAIGLASNRWFGDEEEARAWIGRLLGFLEGAAAGAANRVVKDSNGTPLSEGDSVTVIKDLKVKGAASDLKRGALLKKIRLVDDPDVVECRVDGSTLVLKTCFLKKA